MHHVAGLVVISGSLLAISATRDKGKARPVLRSLVKSGIVAKRKFDAYRAAAVSEAEKLVEEARAELDKPRAEHET